MQPAHHAFFNQFLGDFEKVPERAGALLAAHWTQSEFMNGGLGQFFSNPTGVLAPEAVVAFIALGMPETAAILSEAMLFFGVPYPRDRETRQQVVERFYEEQGEDGNPIGEQEELFGERIEEENGGFWEAADRYAANGEH
ncbi:MAG: DUF4375 domain-containing protein [Verrucomicrobia bacterium]|nr:DUF4375 domain-containing protein [Verrucomicrobiota bacterium]